MTAPINNDSNAATDTESDVSTDVGTENTNTDQNLGEGGLKALQAERDLRKAAEAEAKRHAAEIAKMQETLKSLAPLQKLAESLGVSSEKNEPADDVADRVAKLEENLRKRELAVLKSEVISEAGLPKEAVAFLHGDDVESLKASAEELKGLISAAPSGPRTPKADPNQGPQGTNPDIHARIDAAVKKGDIRESLRLKQELLRNITN